MKYLTTHLNGEKKDPDRKGLQKNTKRPHLTTYMMGERYAQSRRSTTTDREF